MPSFIIVGYVWHILGRAGLFAPPPIREQPRKSPSWIGLNTPNSVTENFIQAVKLEKGVRQYFTLNDLTTLNYTKNNDFSLLYTNINSLQYHFDELWTFLSSWSIQILGVSESRLKNAISATTNILPRINTIGWFQHWPYLVKLKC